MLSFLFAAEACDTIKENNIKEISFRQGKLPFCRQKLPFCWRKLRKAYCIDIFLWRKKPKLQGLGYKTFK